MKYNGKARYSHPGFLAAYGEWQFKALEEYAPYGEIWAPWYTEHKILAGLIAAYEFAGNADALDLAEGIGHWTYARLSKCTKTQLQKMWDIYIGGEYGGMNDSLVDLYNVSKDKDRSEFLKASAFFDTDKLIDNCGAGVDILNNLHANQHIPQFVGYAKDAAMGDADIDADARARYLKAVEGYWGMIVPGRMYAHGGTGEGEMWGRHILWPAISASATRNPARHTTCSRWLAICSLSNKNLPTWTIMSARFSTIFSEVSPVTSIPARPSRRATATCTQ